jgi:methionyl aminopeptidase
VPDTEFAPACLVIQHVEPEGPAVLGDVLVSTGVRLKMCRVFNGDPVPADCEGLSGLVVMGGPMSATSDRDFPTRRAELRLVGQALELGLPILGICLGAQLLALAAGGQVFAGAQGPEIGWGDVELTPDAADDGLLTDLPGRLRVLHWHGDTFDLPPGAQRLAGSAVYPQQAFRVGTCAWGLQFHLEVDAATVAGFAGAFAGEVEASAAGVDVAAIVRDAGGALASLAPARNLVLRRFADLVSRVSMTPTHDFEATSDKFSLAQLLEVRVRTREALHAIAERITPGMVEEDATAMARDLLGTMEMRKGWHRVIVRFGVNTTKDFAATSEPEVTLRENDIFFIDIGPNYQGCEGDAGETFVFGDNPEHHRIKRDVRELWDEVRDVWFKDGQTGIELYDYATRATEARGWKLNLDLSGHRLSDFPHKAIYDGPLATVDFHPSPNLWVLEMAIVDPQGAFGAFYEDLLLPDQSFPSK